MSRKHSSRPLDQTELISPADESGGCSSTRSCCSMAASANATRSAAVGRGSAGLCAGRAATVVAAVDRDGTHAFSLGLPMRRARDRQLGGEFLEASVSAEGATGSSAEACRCISSKRRACSSRQRCSPPMASSSSRPSVASSVRTLSSNAVSNQLRERAMATGQRAELVPATSASAPGKGSGSTSEDDSVGALGSG